MGELDDSVLLDVICSKSRHFAPHPQKRYRTRKLASSLGLLQFYRLSFFLVDDTLEDPPSVFCSYS